MFLRVLRQAFVLVYLFLTLCALSYVLTRYIPFGVPWPFLKHHYAMQAPFQNYIKTNSELIAEGQNANGTWEKIDTQTYLPFGRGEAAIRNRMSGFSSAEKQERYRYMARRILELEAKRGIQYGAVRIVWETWPKSQYGFYHKRTDDQIKRSVVVTYNAQ